MESNKNNINISSNNITDQIIDLDLKKYKFIEDIDHLENHRIAELKNDILLLKDMNQLEYFDVDLVNCTNKDLEKLYKDLEDLSSTINIFNTIVINSQENIDHIESQTKLIKHNIEDNKIDLQEINQKIVLDKIKLVGGAIITGVLFGGVGSIFGLIPALIGTGSGLCAGGIIGNFINKYIN